VEARASGDRCVEMVASGLGYDGGQSNACHAFSEVANAHSAQFSSRYCAQCLAIGTLRSTLYNFGGCIATCVALATEQGYIHVGRRAPKLIARLRL
jgi:hypothetical protein